MKNKYKYIFWGFFSLDYKAMETYLEDMAAKGWMLEKVGRMTAKFRSIEPRNLKFYVDVFTEGGPLTPENTMEAEEYRRLCQESGWNFVASQDYLQFFYAEEGNDPVPIQTDEALEQKIVESTLWKYEMLSFLFTIIVTIIALFKIYPLSHMNFITFTGVAATFLFPLLAVPVLCITIYNLIWMLKSRKNIKSGFTIEKPTLKGARRRAMAFSTPIFIMAFIILIALIADSLFSPDTVVLSLLPMAVGLTIGFGLRYVIKKKIKDKKDSILYVTLAFIILILIVLISSRFPIGRNSNYANRTESIPEDYPQIAIHELWPGAEQGELISSEFKPSMSPVTPRQYNYWETRDINGTTKGIRINYYKTVHPYFAEIIFRGITEKMQEVIRFRGMIIRNKSVITAEYMRDLWNVKNLALTEDKEEILIQKGTTVLHLSGDIDLEKRETREIIIDKFFK